MICHNMGFPPISIIGFGFRWLSSLILVPSPPANITTFISVLHCISGTLYSSRILFCLYSFLPAFHPAYILSCSHSILPASYSRNTFISYYLNVPSGAAIIFFSSPLRYSNSVSSSSPLSFSSSRLIPGTSRASRAFLSKLSSLLGAFWISR